MEEKPVNKILLMILTVLMMLACALPAFAEIIDRGECGKPGSTVIWELDDQYHLVISGSGDMADYSERQRAPWNEYRNRIQLVQIQPGVTSIGDYAFIYHGDIGNI